ncbi:hypothetical protein DFH06DRAFT_1020348 [Mycena polygramma]|nr:hypothetical protein DFH06DRAFT_1020348 [Mycena polygramma]
MLPRAEILVLLTAMGIDLPKKTKLPDAELDKRLSKALDSAQYLTRVLPTPPLNPTSYPSWFDDKSNKLVLEAIMRHNIGEATVIDAIKMRGLDSNPISLYTNPFNDLRQTVMSISNACDNGMRPITLQDKEESSGICMRVLDVRQFDDHTPILIVVFHHDVKGALSRETFNWISSYVSGATEGMMAKITATAQEQRILLRLLNQNKKRLSSAYKPKRAATETSFTLSFLIPVGPLQMQDMAKHSANNGCSICGEPAKQKCSRCGAIRYCGAVCQKDDWKSHRPLCDGWQNAKWQGLTFVLAYRPIHNSTTLRWNKYDIVQHNDVEMRLKSIKDHDSMGPPPVPPNTHGTTPFIVKVQINSSQAQGPAHTFLQFNSDKDSTEMLIYDQRRTIEVTVLLASSETASFNAVAEVVRKRGERGLKAFFWVIRTGEWTIDVCLDQAPEWQLW